MTEKTDWLCIDGDMGARHLPASLFGGLPCKRRLERMNESGDFPASITDLYEGLEVHEVQLIRGFGVEVAGSGYMEMPHYEVYRRREWAEQAELKETA